MDFLEKVGETITNKGREVADKARETAQVAGLRSQIKTCEDVMRKNYLEIGRLYYEAHREDEETRYPDQMRAITNAGEGIADLENRIREIKGS